MMKLHWKSPTEFSRTFITFAWNSQNDLNYAFRTRQQFKILYKLSSLRRASVIDIHSFEAKKFCYSKLQSLSNLFAAEAVRSWDSTRRLSRYSDANASSIFLLSILLFSLAQLGFEQWNATPFRLEIEQRFWWNSDNQHHEDMKNDVILLLPTLVSSPANRYIWRNL